MLKVLNTRLMTNLFDLREKKGKIGCPCAFLNPERQATILKCLHVCGVLFPMWKSTTVFCEDGSKRTGDCPCMRYEESFAKDAFWEYIDRLIIAGKANLPTGVTW